VSSVILGNAIVDMTVYSEREVLKEPGSVRELQDS
jgi:hypothetical protein